MKKFILLYIIAYFTHSYSCSQTTIQSIIQRVEEQKSEWVNSWKTDPLSRLEIKLHSQPLSNLFFYSYEINPLYSIFYSYSPSNRLFVDIYSRTLSVEIQGKDTIIAYAEPESEVILFNTITKQQVRLLYVGEGMNFDDIIWITDDAFIVVGSEYENEQYYPIAILFNVKVMKYDYYKGLNNEMKRDYVEYIFEAYWQKDY